MSPCKVAKCQSLTKVLSREPCFLLCEHFHPVQQEPTRFCESYTKLWRESHRVVQCREKMWLAVPLLLFWMLSCRETPVPCQPARSLWTEKSTNSQQNKCLLPSFWVLVILFQQWEQRNQHTELLRICYDPTHHNSLAQVTDQVCRLTRRWNSMKWYLAWDLKSTKHVCWASSTWTAGTKQRSETICGKLPVLFEEVKTNSMCKHLWCC